jgi:hypothetical protein
LGNQGLWIRLFEGAYERTNFMGALWQCKQGSCRTCLYVLIYMLTLPISLSVKKHGIDLCEGISPTIFRS